MHTLCIIIPAYNEEKKLDITSYEQFIAAQKDTHILFVNDGSNDKTEKLLETLCSSNENAKCITNNQNQGKAQSVLNGMQYAFEHIPSKKYAFLDADLATSLEECYILSESVQNNTTFCFASRILTVGADIHRRSYRHYIGRIVATGISAVLKLEVYDTQCGCKVFENKLAKTIFKDPFISKWLFDVEIFFRVLKHYGRAEGIKKMKEQALRKWEDVGKSKVPFTYFFKLWIDLFKIKKAYKNI